MNIPSKSNPVLLDKGIQAIQELLSSKLSWLDYAFGRSYKIETHSENGPMRKYPAVYTEQGDYQSVLPNDMIGNYSFVTIEDPIEIDQESRTSKIRVKGFITFWLNIANLYADQNAIYAEEVKLEILKVLKSGLKEPGCRLKVVKLYEQPENIFKGYDIRQIDGQFLLYPYYGLKVEIELNIEELCYN